MKKNNFIFIFNFLTLFLIGCFLILFNDIFQNENFVQLNQNNQINVTDAATVTLSVNINKVYGTSSSSNLGTTFELRFNTYRSNNENIHDYETKDISTTGSYSSNLTSSWFEKQRSCRIVFASVGEEGSFVYQYDDGLIDIEYISGSITGGAYGNISQPTFGELYIKWVGYEIIKSVSDYDDGYNFGNISIYWKFECDLNDNGGTNGSGKVQYGTYSKNMSSINKPSRKGYDFKGYYTAATGGSQVINSNLAWVLNINSCKPMTLYAQWQPITYNISYNLDGGTKGSSAPTRGIYNSALTISNPKKQGYTFAGWTASELDTSTAKYGTTSNPTTSWNGTTKVTTTSFKNLRSTSGTVTLTANWTPITYNISYNLNGGTSGTSAPTSGTFDSVLTISNPTKVGYAFAGWTASGLDTTTAKYGSTNSPNTTWGENIYVKSLYFKNLRSTSGTVTLIANWTSYQLTIKYHDGTSSTNSNFDYESSKSVTLPTLNKKGYEFLGWTVGAVGSGSFITGTQNFSNYITTGSTTIDLYPNWKANDYILSFDNNNSNKIRYIRDNLSEGSSANGSNHWLEIQAFGSDGVNYAHKDKGATSKNNLGNDTSNALLNGNIGLSEWQQSGMDIVGNSFQIIDLGQIRDIEYIVVWHYYGDERSYNNNKLEVSADGVNWRTIFSTEDTGKYLEKSHGNKVYVDAYRSKTVTYDNTYGTLPTISKTGYTFAGWYYNNNLITSSTQMTTDQDHMAISKWNVNTYTVQYNGNGNTGGSTVSQTFTYNQTYSLQSNSFTRTGYIFTGWNTQANGQGTSYFNGQSVKNLTSTNKGIVTLYAQWQATWASGGVKQPTNKDSEGYYLISSAEELAWLAYQSESGKLGGKYKQIANINLSSKLWLPIGRLNTFVGEYDGQGYKIIGLRTSDAKDANGQYLESYSGLFGQLDENANIYNVYIENANINGQTCGIIAGSVSDSVIIENCIVSGTVNGTIIGSVVGTGGQIDNCLAINVNISAIGSSSTIKNCLYQLSSGVKGKINFNDYSGWEYNENLYYPIPKAITWYPYNPLTRLTLEEWLSKKN